MKQFQLAQLLPDGNLDNNFATNGKLITSISTNDTPNKLKIQSDGKIVVSGTVYNGNDYDIGILRLNPDGSFDSSFGTERKLSIDFAGNDYFDKLIIDTNGNYVLAGNNSNQDITVLRVIATESPILAVDSKSKETLITIFPNPSSGMFQIECNEELKEVIISNSLGQTETHYNNQIQTTMSGILIITVKTVENIYSSKLIIK